MEGRSMHHVQRTYHSLFDSSLDIFGGTLVKFEELVELNGTRNCN